MPSHDEFPSAQSRRPLFMVDDEDHDRLIFMRLLGAAKITNPCRIFARGEDLIDALIEVLRGAPAPLTCFIDVKMPGMTGFDVLRWIRCQRTLDGIPVVMLSSSEEPRDLTEAQYFGAQCYVAKFPTSAHLQAILSESERMAAAAASGPFRLPCNLLLGTPHVVA